MNNSSEQQNTISIFFIGHFAIDTVIRFTRKNKPSLGGSVSYCSLSLDKYTEDVEISIISNYNEKKFKDPILEQILNSNINLSGIYLSEKRNTNFTLNYHNHSRRLTLRSKSPNLDFSNIPKSLLTESPDAIVLVPICNEISYEYVCNILQHFPKAYIGIDLQGFIRKIEKKRVYLIRDLKIIEETIKIVKKVGKRLILKGSEEEMRILSGEKDCKSIMQFYEQFEGISIMTLGEAGSLIIKKNHEMIKIPAFKSKAVMDETGAGDVYLSIFMYEFLKSKKDWKSVEQAGLFASAAASFDVEKIGVQGFQSKEEVSKRLISKVYINRNGD